MKWIQRYEKFNNINIPLPLEVDQNDGRLYDLESREVDKITNSEIDKVKKIINNCIISCGCRIPIGSNKNHTSGHCQYEIHIDPNITHRSVTISKHIDEYYEIVELAGIDKKRYSIYRVYIADQFDEVLNYLEMKMSEWFKQSVNESIKSDEDTIYIFDFDDTLVDTPSFEDVVMNLIKEDVTSKDLLEQSIKSIGVKISDLKWENGRIYINDTDSKISVTKDWVRKGKRIYLTTPDKFYYLEESLPKELKILSKKYKEVEHKAIVTGRTHEMKDEILKNIKKLGLEEPNLGLHCYPNKTQDIDRVAVWKGKTIVRIIEKSGAKRAYFYEDNSKWLKVAAKMVKEKLPEVEFITVKA